MRRKSIVRIALITAAVLLIPAVAMHFTNQVNWTASDFIIAGILVFGTGLTFELASSRMPKHRTAIGAALAVIFLWLWVELAVGLFTDWGS
jgi:peptidoglycan/LPS O-acetylase OafA/YrhL